MIDINHPANWKFESPTAPGWHNVVSPHNSALQRLSVFRLNLSPGDSHELRHDTLELNLGVVSGTLRLTFNGTDHRLGCRDSVYLIPGDRVTVTAEPGEPVVAFAGAAPFHAVGASYVRRYDPDLPLGAVHQIHGEAPFRREVFMTVDQDTPASSMINGFTWGDSGAWTSWPPHEHTEHLEEVYCYFDLPSPRFALHLCSRKPATVEFVHPVHTGDCVIIPEGYHPTVAMPGSSSSYFWLMAAHRPASRRYDLAVSDPAFV